jgi:hypothetical protein
MSIDIEAKVALIKEWASDNYEKGGHWIVECFSDEDIAESFSSLADAKRYVKRTLEQERNCAWGAPDEEAA